MKVLLQITLLLCTCSMYYNNELNEQPTDVSKSDGRPQLTRTKLSIFPKLKPKFVMHKHKLIDKDNIKSAAVVTKKPIMKKFVTQVTKTEVEMSSKATVSRRPLMKHRSFTLKTFSNHITVNPNYNNKETTDKPKISPFKSNQIDFRHIKLNSNGDRISPSTQQPTNFYAEESRDRNEYIFLNVNSDSEIETKRDFLRPGDEYYETTTDNEKLRYKRNINIIEEEHKPTNHPGWKYNAYDTKLNNDRFYNNVNT